MQALIVAALVAAAAASGYGPALSGTRGVVLPALAAKPVVALPTLAAKPVIALPSLTGRSYGAARRGYADDYAEARPYHYQYAVDDPQYGPMFNKEEQSDGAGNVQGSYAVNLPDGRTQLVKYVSDGYNGFNAEVTYEGYAQHPQVARGYGYGASRGVAGAGRLVAAGGLGLVSRRVGGYGAGVGLAKVGAGLVGRRVAVKPLVYGH